MVRDGKAKNKYRCGHDERQWFVAAVPGASVKDVPSAMESLRPSEIHGGFIRQGEWFFVPCPDLLVNPAAILHNEPINRGRSKPHFCQELYRRGGQQVMVTRQHPTGLSDEAYQKIIEENPKALHWGWQRMTRDIVHEVAHIFHNCKRATLGLRETRTRVWLLWRAGLPLASR